MGSNERGLCAKKEDIQYVDQMSNTIALPYLQKY